MSEKLMFACDCNGTARMQLNVVHEALAQGAQKVSLRTASQLCRKESVEFAQACLGNEDILVNCTQEQTYFEEIAASKKVLAPVRFFNTREFAAWGKQGAQAAPKIAALAAVALQEPMEPVPSVSYQSRGKLAIIGNAAQVDAWCRQLSAQLSVMGFVVSAGGSPLESGGLQGEARSWALANADSIALTGWLGNFNLTWSSGAAIDLEACVRCGACINACPEGAISTWLEVDLNKCTGHRECVQACADIGAINFARESVPQEERFDLILDLRERSAFDRHQPPQGYFLEKNFDSPLATALAVQSMVGEFEKPKFFEYRDAICAHSRNEKIGCKQCLDICSAQAISSIGNSISVNPHLCVGCGACTTVCPSGALSYSYPKTSQLSTRLRAGLQAFRRAGGRDAALLFFDAEHGGPLIESLSRVSFRRGPAELPRKDTPGLAAHVIPFAVQHSASAGLDTWLSALAYGAGQVMVLLDGSQAPQYAQALKSQAQIANTILLGMGYPANAVVVIDGADSMQCRTTLSGEAHSTRAAISPAATFQLTDDKRRSMEMAIDHLSKYAPVNATQSGPIALPQGSPFGRIAVDTTACTLCLACVGACPSKALADNQEAPQLRFLERNCVQCGLCEATCPETAIRLVPQLRVGDSARQWEVLNEAKPFHCTRCSKPFGTAAMVESMLTKLAGHSLFAGEAIGRLKMCADCRVVDMMDNRKENTIFDFEEAPVLGRTKGKP